MKLREYCEQRLEALGFEPEIELELEDGSTVKLVHPWLWDDSTIAAANKAKSNADMAKAVLGDDEHKRFIAAGGQNSELALAVELLKRQIKDDQGASPDPKGS